MNRKHVVLVAAILVVVAIVVAVFFATKSDPVTVVDEPTITAYVNGTSVEGVLKDNEVVIDGKTMDEWKAEGYDVVYNRVLNEIEVHISTVADVDKNEVEHNGDNVVNNSGEVVNNEGTNNNQENTDANNGNNVGETGNNDSTDKAETEKNPIIGEVTDKDDTKTPDESKDNPTQTETTNKEDKNNGNVGSDKTENPSKPVEPEHTHKYTSKVVNPTCVDHGYTLYTCECGHSYESDDFVPATGHDYKSTKVVAPTTSERGYTVYTCSKCNHSYNDDYVPKLSSSDWIDNKLSDDGKNVVLDKVSVNIFSVGKETLDGITEADIIAYVNAAAPSDFEGQKVGINRVDAEDPANMRTDGLGTWAFSLAYQPEGTLISHSALKKTGSGQAAIDYFIDTMAQIDWVLERNADSTLKDGGKNCGQYFYKNGSYQLSFGSWGDSWGGFGTNVTRSVYLNALSYFGGEKMGVAVWSMLEEHLHYRNARYMISDELAAKYGLKIVHNGTMSPNDGGVDSFNIRADYVKGLKVTDGTQTWTIDYPLYLENMDVTIYIPA